MQESLNHMKIYMMHNSKISNLKMQNAKRKLQSTKNVEFGVKIVIGYRVLISLLLCPCQTLKYIHDHFVQ